MILIDFYFSKIKKKTQSLIKLIIYFNFYTQNLEKFELNIYIIRFEI